MALTCTSQSKGTCIAQGAFAGRSPRGAGSARWHPPDTARTRASLAAPPPPRASAACPAAAALPAGAVQVKGIFLEVHCKHHPPPWRRQDLHIGPWTNLRFI